MKKNQRLKKLVKMMGACFLIGAVSLSSLVGCAPTNQGMLEDVNPSMAEDVLTPGFDVIASNTAELKLFSSEANVVKGERVYFVEKTITATVYPLDAQSKYKEVKWSLDWVDETDEDDVSNYVVIEQSATDSKVLTLRCYQAFLNRDMVLTCETVYGSFTATARVSYYGAPTSFSLSGLPDKSFVGNLEYYELFNGEKVAASPILKNEFDCVNPEFAPEYSVNVQAFGSVILTNGSEVSFLAKQVEGDANRYNVSLPFGTGAYSVATVLLSKTGLSVDGIKSVEALNAGDFVFDSFKPGEPFCYFTVTITENVTGISNSYSFRVVSKPSSVSLDLSEIVF